MASNLSIKTWKASGSTLGYYQWVKEQTGTTPVPVRPSVVRNRQGDVTASKPEVAEDTAEAVEEPAPADEGTEDGEPLPMSYGSIDG